MKWTTISSPAKFNLFLQVKNSCKKTINKNQNNKNQNKHHAIKTVLIRLDAPCDFLHIKPAKQLSFFCDNKLVPISTQKNSILKAIKLLEKKTGKKFTYEIRLKKNIPLLSGLGGGASNAAAILLFLNKTEKLGLTQKALMRIGEKVGMDVPFFISGHACALGTHFGEKIKPLPPLPKDIKIKIFPYVKKLSTRFAYKKLDRLCARTPTNKSRLPEQKSKSLVSALKTQDSQKILASLHNDFTKIYPPPPSPSPLPQVASLSASAFVPLLAGSGGSYGVFYVAKTKKSKKLK
jgi:4-diphosphocytidyl-2-C-methyl-D-erythritol kinase